MFAGFFRELKAQILTFVRIIRTREFWIYVAVIMVMVAIVAAVIRLAFGFDPLTRGRLGIPFSCRTGEGQLATIIVGAFAFGIACAFTLGEVVSWVEETRQARAPGRHYKIGYWRPVLHVVGTVVLGVGGYLLMLTWCT